ncbi:Dps family protein [Lactobacillus psittaci]|uniref:DNA protection during starvation protein n=1 Tax=Lactobacillus psittaci DSM 15354 TaxID=1122152 RepID=A0A0R1S3H2_9LACO|nr:DNA starvation/stationary phase protection protein [Lactobacillus psittaci]KRL63616.1 DNA protection during starvation protein [Lactobacillus psittaci DSM 15354]
MKYPETKKILNQAVADLNQMIAVVRQTHWYMRGRGFMKLHPLMDDFMDDLNEQMDVISERLIAIDGAPYSTLGEYVENTKIPDEKGRWDRTMEERLEILVKDYRYLNDLYEKGLETADKEGDAATNDIFTGFKAANDKRIWMLQAELGKAPEIDA